ncbi:MULTISPECIES: hypothetical protein [Methanobacterium]|uniref:hypothetical protein n=1 Tax=Methanobacterium TaxID=2160 RepID=UPI00159F1A43|nr:MULTISPECIES: hypothetical protein [Methanobacterium]
MHAVEKFTIFRATERSSVCYAFEGFVLTDFCGIVEDILYGSGCVMGEAPGFRL